MLYRKKKFDIMKNVDIKEEENFRPNTDNIETRQEEIIEEYK